MGLTDQRHDLRAVMGFGHDLKVAVELEQLANPGEQQRMIIGNQDPHDDRSSLSDSDAGKTWGWIATANEVCASAWAERISVAADTATARAAQSATRPNRRSGRTLLTAPPRSRRR